MYFWSRGYIDSTIGLDDKDVRIYTRSRECSEEATLLGFGKLAATAPTGIPGVQVYF
jgi:hypothetical protein